MGFLSGRVSFARYRVRGRSPGTFGQKHLDKLGDHAAGQQPFPAIPGLKTVLVDEGGGAPFQVSIDGSRHGIEYCPRPARFNFPSSTSASHTAVGN